MNVTAAKAWAAVMGAGAVVAAVSVCLMSSTAAPSHDLASGSGDSATGTVYTQPMIPAMSIGSTATSPPIPTVETAAATMATSQASPTLKATPPKGF